MACGQPRSVARASGALELRRELLQEVLGVVGVVILHHLRRLRGHAALQVQLDGLLVPSPADPPFSKGRNQPQIKSRDPFSYSKLTGVRFRLY